MREFELYGTVNCIISLCDSLNYITEEEELLQVFCLVNNYLHPKGLFIFDLNTEYKFKEILAQNSFSETKEDSAYIWENYYDEQEKINEYYVYEVNLLKRKEDVIRLIDEKGLLTEELQKQILDAKKLVEVEDLYRPYKEKKKTKATEAIKNGLEPLAKKMMSFPVEGNFTILTKPYLT